MSTGTKLNLKLTAARSERFAVLADQLSKYIDRADSFLGELPGKLKVYVNGPSGALWFTKGTKGWGLFYDTIAEDGDKDITSFYLVESPARIKAEAAPLIPALLARFHDELADVNGKCEEALRVLESLPSEVFA
jgi:hypothetical protein